jgi:imidazolonepropionase-like amidohydrolase
MRIRFGAIGRIAGAFVLALLTGRGIGSAQPTALVGGTLIDVRNFGRSTNDIPGAVVVIDNGKILTAGPAAHVAIPPDSRRIDVHGKYLIPGLIDGFGALRAQSFADAY